MNMVTPKPSLRDYQVADLAYYIANPKCMNLSDPGTGKTPSVCVWIYYLWTHHGVGTAWVMPKRLMKKNRDELLRFTNFTEDDVVIVDGSPSQVRKQLNSGAKVYLMGFRRWALSWRQLPKFVKAVPVDEFHMGFKSESSAQTQALFAAFECGQMEYFLPMTGTLVEGKLSSAYPAIKIIEPRYYANERAFLYQHAIYDLDDKIIGWKNHAKLSAIFGRHGIRRTFADIYGQQEIVVIPEVVEMSPHQRGMYDEFHEKAILELEKFYLDGTQPGVSFIRARQLMEHPNEFPDLTTPGQFIDIMPGEVPGKEELLEIHLEHHASTGTPFIIFSALVPQQRRLARLLDRFRVKYAVINGQVSQKESDEADRAFRAGEIDHLICSPKCASVGFNWQFCGKHEVDHMCFVSMDYNDTTFIQAVQRAIRGKREKPLRVTTLEYADSLDQRIFSIIYRKSVDAHKVDPTRPILQLSGYNKEYEMVT
jgi:Superfamily II DNA/RNA helicases, SNF2 family